MKLSCIMTTYNDGALLRQSVASILGQTFEDFELVIVDDGSGAQTRAVLAEFGDPRVRVIPQANDGVSSARNRALHHARGEIITFLDGDDVKAPWAFAAAIARMEETGAELLMVQGLLSGERSAIEPFYDSDHFTARASEGAEGLADAKAWATTLEPQSANKYIRRAVIERGKIRYPHDHIFEDMFFHVMCIAHARSIAFLEGPNFTYFQRALRPQLTGVRSETRFDVVGTTGLLLQMFERLPDFRNARQRGALMIGVMRMVEWCETCISAYHRFAFRLALRDCLRGLDPLFFVLPKSVPDPRGDRARLEAYLKEVMA